MPDAAPKPNSIGVQLYWRATLLALPALMHSAHCLPSKNFTKYNLNYIFATHLLNAISFPFFLLHFFSFRFFYFFSFHFTLFLFFSFLFILLHFISFHFLLFPFLPFFCYLRPTPPIILGTLTHPSFRASPAQLFHIHRPLSSLRPLPTVFVASAAHLVVVVVVVTAVLAVLLIILPHLPSSSIPSSSFTFISFH